MNSGQRIGLLAAAVAVLVIAFFVLSPSDSTDDTASTPTTATTVRPPAPPVTAIEPAAPAATATEPAAPPATTTEPGTTGGTTVPTTPATGGTEPTTTTAAPPQPAYTTIRVRDGKPVGGVKTIQTRSGERVRIQVTSPDTSDEVHLHGYDIARDLRPGKRARFSFEAEAEGIFEMELEGSHIQIAKLEVRPR